MNVCRRAHNRERRTLLWIFCLIHWCSIRRIQIGCHETVQETIIECWILLCRLTWNRLRNCWLGKWRETGWLQLRWKAGWRRNRWNWRLRGCWNSFETTKIFKWLSTLLIRGEKTIPYFESSFAMLDATAIGWIVGKFFVTLFSAEFDEFRHDELKSSILNSGNGELGVSAILPNIQAK